MRKRICLLTVVMSSLVLLAGGCSGSGAGTGSGGAQGGAPAAAAQSDGDTVVLRAGFSTKSEDPRVVATELFGEEIEKATNGRIKVEITPEQAGDSELISGVVNGELDITASSAGNFATYDPNVGISALPFLFEDFDQAWAFVDGETEREAESGLVDNSIKVLGHYDNGFRCVTTSEQYGPIEGVEDMQGLKIRTPENAIVMQTMQILGAQAEVLGFDKLPEALKNGEFDAQENPIPVILNNRLYEVQKNLAITNHSYDVMLFVINNEVWESFSPEEQQIISDAAAKAQAKDRELVREQTENGIDSLVENGMNVTYPDINEFKEATSSVIDYFAKDYKPELIEKIR